jgi:hypothetical protein
MKRYIFFVGTASRTFDVSILDPLGNLVISANQALPGRLSLSSVPAGVYFYSVVDNNKTIGFGKFLKVE